jgi:hypothetical protein
MSVPPQLDAIIQSASKVTLPGGVVGKVCKVLIIASVCIAAIACFVGQILVGIIAIALIFVLVGVLAWKLIDFANKNPAAALLEGAEFLLHEQAQLGMKNTPVLPKLNSPQPPGPNPITPADKSSISDVVEIPPKTHG